MEKVLVKPPKVKYQPQEIDHTWYTISAKYIDVYEYVAISPYTAKLIRFSISRSYRTAYLIFRPSDELLVNHDDRIEVHGGITFSNSVKFTEFVNVFKDFRYTFMRDCWVWGIDFSHISDLPDVDAAYRYLDALEFHPDEEVRCYSQNSQHIRDAIAIYETYAKNMVSITAQIADEEETVKTYEYVYNELQQFERDVKKYIENQGEMLLPIIDTNDGAQSGVFATPSTRKIIQF